MSRPTNKNYGFGLTEVLISAAILGVGLIGLASLQSKSIQAVQEGDNLVTAAVIAEEVAKRMLANPYITAQGRSGYLATDLSGAIAADGGVPTWATATQSANPNIANCYGITDSQSCYNPGATIGNSSEHIQALQNMQIMDQIEMRLLAWNTLPQGQIMICFDSSTAYTAFTCDNTATRVTWSNATASPASINENVFTVKVQWQNILTNTTQMYTLQFTAQCNVTGANYCT